MATTIRELFDRGADADPVIAAPGWPSLTDAELRAEVDRLAGQLRALGIGEGDRVAILLPQGPELAVALLAVASCASAVTLTLADRAPSLRSELADLGVRALLTAGADIPRADEVRPPAALDLLLGGNAGRLRISCGGRAPHPLPASLAAPGDEAYAATGRQIASNPLPPGVRKAESVDRACGVELAIVNEQGQLLPCGTRGEIAMREPSPAADEDWRRTGDRGYQDADDYLIPRERRALADDRRGHPRPIDGWRCARRRRRAPSSSRSRCTRSRASPPSPRRAGTPAWCS